MARDYTADFRKILEQISLADIQGTETPAADLLDLNMSDSLGRRFNGAHLRNALRAGEAAGYGSLIVGRRGYPTRFAWSKVPAKVAAQADPAPAPPVPSAPSAPAPAATADRGSSSSSSSIVHSLQLRANTTVEIALPADLTPREAERLAYWMQALSFG